MLSLSSLFYLLFFNQLEMLFMEDAQEEEKKLSRISEERRGQIEETSALKILLTLALGE